MKIPSLYSGLDLSDDQPSSRSLPRVSSSEQKTLLSFRKLQGFQEACVRSQSKRPNTRTKDAPSALTTQEISRVSGALCQQMTVQTSMYFPLFHTYKRVISYHAFSTSVFSSFYPWIYTHSQMHVLFCSIESCHILLLLSIMWVNCMIFSSPSYSTSLVALHIFGSKMNMNLSQDIL